MGAVIEGRKPWERDWGPPVASGKPWERNWGGSKLEQATEASVERASNAALLRTKYPGTDEGQRAAGKIATYPRREEVRLEHFSPDTPAGALNLGMAGVAAGAAVVPTTLAGAGSLVASSGLGYLSEKAGLPWWVGSTIGALAGGGAPSLGRKAVGKLLAGKFAGRVAPAAEVSIPAGASSSLAALPSSAVRGAATATETSGAVNTLVETGWSLPAARAHVAELAAKQGTAAAKASTIGELAGLPGVVPKAVPKALPDTLTQEQLRVVTQLKAAAQQSGASKIQVVQAAQQVFPDNWKQVVDFVMAPRTTMGVR